MSFINRLILGSNRNILRRDFSWNMISSILNAATSAVLLLIVTAINGVEDAGVFQIGFTIAQMMINIGNYGMRTYHATDVKEKYEFNVYFSSRIITVLLMIVVSIVYTSFRNYNLFKFGVVIFLCLLKATDAFEDIFDAHYQLRGKLYVGGKIWSVRVISYSFIFFITLLVTKNLLLACLFAFLTSLIVLLLSTLSLKNTFNITKPSTDFKMVFKLLLECLALCIGAFLLSYIVSAPKYAIDTYMSDEAQAYYGYLSMPCFIINMFVNLILRPTLVSLSTKWNNGEYSKFAWLSCKLILAALAIIGVVLIGGYFLGCPLLSWFYGVNLTSYRTELMILLAGGGFFTIAAILQIVLTVMRHQYAALVGFIIASISGFFVSSILVSRYGIMGGAMSFTITVAILAFVFILTAIYFYIKNDLEVKNAKAI